MSTPTSQAAARFLDDPEARRQSTGESGTALVHIAEFTDPGCPFAWSAEPARRRLEWLYGDQIEWSLHMVGLASDPQEYLDKGFTAERQSGAFARLAHEHHMPIDTSERPRMAATVPACRAIVAVRRHRPISERTILRELRRLHFSGALLDDPATLAEAAQRSGISPADLETWMGEPDTEALLQEDIEAAREPTESAVQLAHKLAPSDGGYRYTCPSYEIRRVSDGATGTVPGFQPVAAYEVVIANLCPQAQRRADPDSVEEVLDWAGEPLATAEVAGVCNMSLDEAREALGRVAVEEHVGFDGFWRLA